MLSKHGVRAALLPLVLLWSAAAHLAADDLGKQAEILNTVNQVVQQGPFRPDFASLSQYQIPDWYRDAKFGIFLHWGVYSVPAWDTEWYPHYMYQFGTDEYWHQLSTYGPLTVSGYKDFIPSLTGSRFNPDAWVRLFKKCGARFVVPVSEHHDGFSMWNNPLNSYNAVNMGPQQDVVGALAVAARKHGLAFGLSNHRSEHRYYFEYGMQVPGSDVQNPAFADLYGPAQPGSTPPDAPFLDNWLARAAASIDAYHPDFFYFDAGLTGPFFQPYLQRIGAHLYNRAAQWNQNVAFTVKDGYPGHTAIFDTEQGSLPGISPAVWQEDTSEAFASWGYISNATYKDPGLLVRELVDTVSKNGILLLNLGPKPDGTLPTEEQQILEGIGRWLAVNGESIYGTRPWNAFGEGTNQFTPGTFGDAALPTFTGQDIRFTVKGNVLYAVLLAWPGQQATITSLTSGTVANVQLLGYDVPLNWNQTSSGLVVSLPPNPPVGLEYAYVLKITGLKMPGIAADPNGTSRLSCGQADIGQSSIQQFQYGLTRSCYWNTRQDSASWAAHFNAPGNYSVTASAAAAAGTTAILLKGCGASTNIPVAASVDWGTFADTVPVYVNIPVAGDCTFVAQPYGPVNVVHIDVHPIVMPSANGALHLTPSAATINGTTLRVETYWGPEDLGFWNNGIESASWRVHFPAAGNYTVTAGFSTTVTSNSVTIDIGDQPALASLPVTVANTGGWDKVVALKAGTVVVPQPGDYTISMRATDLSHWQPVDLYYMDLTP